MTLVSSIARHRKALASGVAIAVIAAIPIGFAVVHQGFPETDVTLDAREVWVTNGTALLGGRLNRQIEELNGAVSGQARDLDVVQDGESVFLVEAAEGRISRIDPAYTTLVEPARIPEGSTVALGGSSLAILSPSGSLWAVDVSNGLTFDPATAPAAQLGAGAQVVVTSSGAVVATSATTQSLVRLSRPGASVSRRVFDVPRDAQLAASGQHAVLLDAASHRLLRDDGSAVTLPDSVTSIARLQRSSSNGDQVAISTGSSTIVVTAAGAVSTLSARIATPVTTAAQISRPVVVAGCIHAAWAGAQRYLLSCPGQTLRTEDIEQRTQSSTIEFRVNRAVVALNDLSTGNVWLLDDELRLVKNWDQVTPPQQDETTDGDQKATTQSFADTLADRTDVNHPPIARDDDYGVRPGRTTILPVLSNDSDPDGDVLTVPKFDDMPASVGTIDLIDGARALQFTPAPGATAASFRYTVSDGRGGGVAEALVTVRVVPSEVNNAPVSQRTTSVSVELGGTISYNALVDWIDPDGDDISLDAASASSADSVRSTPAGLITFASTSGQPGTKDVQFTVSDGRLTSTGTLEVKVVAPGSLTPIGTPDFVETFRGQSVEIRPLENDISTNGQLPTLLGVDKVPAGVTVIPDTTTGTITVTSPTAGSYYFQYSLAAGAASSVGLVRVDVLPDPTVPGPPIAVKDAAFLRPGEPTSVKVLNNDVSPSGAVLAVQTIDTTDTDPAVTVEVLSNAVVRITATAALTAQTQFHYTISDGSRTAMAGVTIVPVAPIVNRQPPIAVDDSVRVRAGDVVSANVLANDFHPDSAQLILDPQLVETADAGDGLAFAGDGRVRYQAGTTPGSFSVAYRVSDQFDESATARVTFVVVARDAKTNQPPVPLPQIARVFAGSSVPIQVPLDGIDPDGDSVLVTGIATPPHLGVVTDLSADSFRYTALPGSSGTDSFSYVVEDSYGAQSIGTISIGVVPRPASAAPPNAVDDAIEMQPGRVATVGVLLNDSDPSGYTISLDTKLVEVAPGVAATVDRSKIVVHAPEAEGTYSIRYRITNGYGGQDTAFLQVKVTTTAAPIPPTATDHYVSVDEVVGKTSVTVPIDGLIANPAGRDDDLTISVEGPNAAQARVDRATRSITVSPGDHRLAIAYRVTNPDDGLSATAIISVPQAVSSDYAPPPHLRRDLTLPQLVPQDASRSWKLSEIVTVPSGKPASLTAVSDVSATHGTASATDDKNLTFTAQGGYRGPASITFRVSDGSSRSALLSMTLAVGDPSFSDVAPQFVTQNVTIEAGENPKSVDLRASTSDPNPALVTQFRYESLGGVTTAIAATLNGGSLQLSSPFGTPSGTKTTLHFEIRFKDFTVPGTVNVTVVSSTRPLAQAVPDAAKGQRGVTDTVNVLVNDYNPFAAKNEPLTLIEAHVENAAESSATMSFTSHGGVTIQPGASFIGVISVVYTVQDATKDPARDVTGRLQYTVRDVPAKPTAPTFVEGDGTITLSWTAPATNGEPITGYTISSTGGAPSPVKVDGSKASYVFSGLSNGTGYTFRIAATNVVGDGQLSDASATATPYGSPSPVSSATLTGSSNGSGQVTLNWSGASGNGRDISGYRITMSPGGQVVDVGAVSTTTVGGGHVGTAYSYSIVTLNSGGRQSSSVNSNNSGTPLPSTPSASASLGSDGKTVTVSWGTVTSTDPVSYHVVVVNGPTYDDTAAGSRSFTGAFGTSYSFTVTATSNGVASSNSSNTVTAQDPYAAHLCYGSTLSGGNRLGVAWSGNNYGSHRVTFSIGTSELTFSGASGSAQSQAWAARNTSGDLNQTVTWTDSYNGTTDNHSTRWGDAPPC